MPSNSYSVLTGISTARLLRLAAACTTGGTLPGMKPLPPFQVIYQTAEDGLGDTVKPRLIEAAADLDRVLVIDEAKRELTLSDERIPGLRFYRLPRRSKERPADRAREARTECARYRP